MKNVVIRGVSGNIAKYVIDILIKRNDINLTFFLRNAGISKEFKCSKMS